MARVGPESVDLKDVLNAAPGYQGMADSELTRKIFGDDSDLSDSDDEKHRKAPSKSPKKARKQPPAYAGSVSGPEEDYEGSGAPSTRKRKPRPTATAEDADAPKRKKKKKEKPAPDPEDELPLTEEQMRKLKIDQSIKDAIKTSKRARKRKQNEDDLDNLADDQVKKLRADMLAAADEDRKAHEAGIPALAKLRMLDVVMDTMQKRQYATSIMDQDLLGACRVWLEPLDNKSLPALNIQTAFFELFEKMPIDTETLRESGLGKIVLFYTKCSRVIPRIARIAVNLVDTWTRPILKRSASYFDKVVPVVEDMDSVRMPALKLAAILQEARQRDARIREDAAGEAGPGKSKTMRVTIPEKSNMTYTVAPRISTSLANRTRGPQDDMLESRRVNKEMLRKLQKKTEKSGKA